MGISYHDGRSRGSSTRTHTAGHRGRWSGTRRRFVEQHAERCGLQKFCQRYFFGGALPCPAPANPNLDL